MQEAGPAADLRSASLERQQVIRLLVDEAAGALSGGGHAKELEKARARAEELQRQAWALEAQLQDLRGIARDAQERAVLAQIDADKATRKAESVQVGLAHKRKEEEVARRTVAELSIR